MNLFKECKNCFCHKMTDKLLNDAGKCLIDKVIQLKNDPPYNLVTIKEVKSVVRIKSSIYIEVIGVTENRRYVSILIERKEYLSLCRIMKKITSLDNIFIKDITDYILKDR